MTSTASPAMQKADLDAVSPDVEGLISKQTAELDGVSVTRVCFDVGARSGLPQFVGRFGLDR